MGNMYKASCHTGENMNKKKNSSESRRFYTFYEIALENNTFSEKFCVFEKEFSFSDKFSEIFIHIKINA